MMSWMPWLARIAVVLTFAGLFAAPIVVLADDSPPPDASTVATTTPAPPVEITTTPEPSAPSPPPPPSGQVVTIVLPPAPEKAPAKDKPVTPSEPGATSTTAPDSSATGTATPPPAPPPPQPAGERGGPSTLLPVSIRGGRTTVEIVPRSRRSEQALPAGVVVREDGFLSGVPRWLLGVVLLLGASQLVLLVRLAYRR